MHHWRWRVAAVMGCMWAVSLMYGEVFSYWVPRFRCPWPPLPVSAPILALAPPENSKILLESSLNLNGASRRELVVYDLPSVVLCTKSITFFLSLVMAHA